MIFNLKYWKSKPAQSGFSLFTTDEEVISAKTKQAIETPMLMNETFSTKQRSNPSHEEKMKTLKNGFSLTEILVSVGILGILTSISMPVDIIR